MSIPNFSYLEGLTSMEEVQGALAQLKRTLDFYFQGKMSTSNIRELAGWQASEDLLMSLDEDVGFSTIDTAADDLRIWAGATARETAPFRVYESGRMHATRGEIGGWQITDSRLQDQAGLVGFSSELTGANDVRIWAGHININQAPFRVYESGEIYSIAGHIGGWKIGPDTLSDLYGYAGMSASTSGLTNVRFWAGGSNPNNSPFVVYDNGDVYVSNLTATGGTVSGSTLIGNTIQTGDLGQSRLELSGAGFRGLTSDGLLNGLVFNPTPTDDVDLFLYHRGTKLLEFYDNITNFHIRPALGAMGMGLGISGQTVYALGTWDFSNANVLGLSFFGSGVTDSSGDPAHSHNFSVSGNVF